MNKNSAIVLIGVAALVYWFISNQKKKLTKSVSADNIKVHKITFDKKKSEAAAFTTLYFNVELKVTNDTDVNATIDSVNIKAIYSGSTLADVKSKTIINVPANSSKSVIVLMSVPMATGVVGIVNAVRDLIAGRSMFLRITGNVEALGGNIDIDKTLPVTLL